MIIRIQYCTVCTVLVPSDPQPSPLQKEEYVLLYRISSFVQVLFYCTYCRTVLLYSTTVRDFYKYSTVQSSYVLDSIAFVCLIEFRL